MDSSETWTLIGVWSFTPLFATDFLIQIVKSEFRAARLKQSGACRI